MTAMAVVYTILTVSVTVTAFVPVRVQTDCCAQETA